ncbi:NAD(P)/FAD-dependent oxidoreductase [Mucilaginibacter sp. KACC 22773]|uniref:NAD(P)/FAD-dependent oxidoreductase n=1 Tax=Mucilaginibacter sp. KACC 22773 TaxID=3025671 RepID=UPI002365668A|nr:NAD(P)/FAD-dependent oxidoreductase [Mucilaginibacter sp. KACC 22773]WDF78475.1 NAD(P)/FAD-dependent oxidoreductase [Mucilaginibacter sp. KACC 22773]
MNDVIIVGGGLAGLFNAILLNRAGLNVTLVEKKTYPMHRVCGEYISNEVIPFLNTLDINLDQLNVARINRVEVTAASGVKFTQKLDLGGFGLSRYTFDNFLYHKAATEGVNFLIGTRVEDVRFTGNQFEVVTPGEVLTAPLVIGSFGKRSNLDQKLKRPFFYKRSPYLAVKFHIKMDLPQDLIQLNNYKDGYCGVSKTDGDRYCMCYMAHRDDLRKYGSLQGLEENVIRKNPYLDNIFTNAEFLLDKPEVINEISFEKKAPVDNHILMSGDTAGMIAPLCGNGMTMAIHSAKILSEKIISHYKTGKFYEDNRVALEADYTDAWNRQFAQRLWVGRQLQRLFGNNNTTALTLRLLNGLPPLSRYLISKTHGKPFS